MPERISMVIPRVLKRTRAQQQTLSKIQRNWRGLVGAALATHSRPVSLRRGRLIIHVEEPGDSFALEYRRPKVLQRLETLVPGQVQARVARAGQV